MRSSHRILAAAAVLAATLLPAPTFGQQGSVPAVIFRSEPTYQAMVAADGTDAPQRGDPAEDARWAERRAESLTDFYESDGARLLRLLSDYAGVEWPYAEISVYLVRRFPTLSIQYPFTIAVGEIRQGSARQEVPGSDFLTLVFAHQIAHYLLDPPPEALAAERPDALDHPLMEEGNYRREALVNLVTYRALEDLWGRQRLGEAVEEPLWASYNPEAAFVDSLQTAWDVSLSRPLVSWLREEGRDGRLVRLAEHRESRGRADTGDRTPAPPAGGGLAGTELGFDLGQTSEGRLVIAFLDRGSPADAAGLHSGDVVLTIEGRRFQSSSEAMAVARDAWEDNGEVNLSVERQGKEVFFQVH